MHNFRALTLRTVNLDVEFSKEIPVSYVGLISIVFLLSNRNN